MKFNKIAACFAAAACSVSMLSVMSVSAADSFTIKAGSASPTTVGETFKLDIELAGVPSSGVAGLDFGIKYDSSVFEVVSIDEGAVSKTSDKYVGDSSSNLETNKEAGKVSVLWATGQISTNSSWIKSDGVLLTLNCKLLKAGETSDVEIVPGSRKGATSVDAAVEGLKIVNPATVKGTVGSTPVKFIYGDVDLSGEVDLSDLIMLSQHQLHDITLTGDNLKAADCDGDGDVTITDLPRLKQFIMHDKVTLGPQK